MASKNVRRKCPDCGITDIYHVEDGSWTHATCPRCGFSFPIIVRVKKHIEELD